MKDEFHRKHKALEKDVGSSSATAEQRFKDKEADLERQLQEKEDEIDELISSHQT
jgi:hypothetical protein